MSQAGIVDVEAANPQIPTLFVCNVGSAIPIANTLEILGTAVAAHSVPLETVGSGNTVSIDVQYTSAAASSVANNAGIASFNSAYFTVDANGYVTISGGSVIELFEVDASTPPGTNPVAPNGSGVVTITGGQVAAGTTVNVIQTNSLSANTYTVQIQRSQAVASSTVGDNGVSHFDSTYFTVDANGFVSLMGGSVTELFEVQANTAPGTNPVLPTGAGLVTVNGAAVANHSVVLETRSRAANTYNIEVQYATTAASTTADLSGVSHFDSAVFTVDANGFVSLIGAGPAIESVNLQAGTTPIVPNSGAITLNGAVVAAGSTPIQTYGTDANTAAVQVQISQAIASTDATKIGLAAFSSANFSVDANGFVTAFAITMNYTNVAHIDSPYTVLSTDEYISVDCSAGVVTLKFPNAPTPLQTWIVKDRTGNASLYNITLTTPGATVTFDGLTSYTMNSNYQAINILANATPTYEVY